MFTIVLKVVKAAYEVVVDGAGVAQVVNWLPMFLECCGRCYGQVSQHVLEAK